MINQVRIKKVFIKKVVLLSTAGGGFPEVGSAPLLESEISEFLNACKYH
jgi:hypothetical protein